MILWPSTETEFGDESGSVVRPREKTAPAGLSRGCEVGRRGEGACESDR